MIEYRQSFQDENTVDSIIKAAVNIDFDSTLGAVRASLCAIQPESVDLSLGNSLGVLNLPKEHPAAGLGKLLPNLLKSALSLEHAIWSQTNSEGDISDKGRFSQLITTFFHVLYPPDLSDIKHGYFSVKTRRYPFPPQNVNRQGRKIEKSNNRSPVDIVAEVYELISQNTLILDSFPFLSTDYGERFSSLNGTVSGFAEQEMIRKCRDGRNFDEISSALEYAKKFEIQPHLLIGLSDEKGKCLSAMKCDLRYINKTLGLNIYGMAFPQIKTFMPLPKFPKVEDKDYLAEIGRDFEALSIKPGYRLRTFHDEPVQINTGVIANRARSL